MRFKVRPRRVRSRESLVSLTICIRFETASSRVWQNVQLKRKKGQYLLGGLNLAICHGWVIYVDSVAPGYNLVSKNSHDQK